MWNHGMTSSYGCDPISSVDWSIWFRLLFQPTLDGVRWWGTDMPPAAQCSVAEHQCDDSLSYDMNLFARRLTDECRRRFQRDFFCPSLHCYFWLLFLVFLPFLYEVDSQEILKILFVSSTSLFSITVFLPWSPLSTRSYQRSCCKSEESLLIQLEPSA